MELEQEKIVDSDSNSELLRDSFTLKTYVLFDVTNAVNFGSQARRKLSASGLDGQQPFRLTNRAGSAGRDTYRQDGGRIQPGTLLALGRVTGVAVPGASVG
jgi:hypothetical protein